MDGPPTTHRVGRSQRSPAANLLSRVEPRFSDVDGDTAVASQQTRLAAYVPRVAAEWGLDSPNCPWQVIDGTLCFIDISGFTRLSERLAQRGRIGAEELTEVLSRVFGNMLDLAYQRGGSLLKFGGDALLLFFQGPDHPVQACSAAVEMRSALREAVKIPTSVGRISLRMSVGIHSGPVHFFSVGGSHHELIVTGPTATRTTLMEQTAEAGEIVVSPETLSALPGVAATQPKGEGWILSSRKPALSPGQFIDRRWVQRVEIEQGVPLGLRQFLSDNTEAEHRVSTVGFIRFEGVDALMEAGGPEPVAAALEELVSTVQEAVDGEGVTFLASDIDRDGGKIILCAGVPIAQEDDEGRLIRAARRIAETPMRLTVRIGINRGHVFAGDVGNRFRRTYTVMGDTVNLAARLMAAAPPGRVYASPAVLDRSRTLFESTALEPLMVKGKTAPVQAYMVGPETGIRESVTHGKLPFAGRGSELAELHALLAKTESTTAGIVVTVAGETGIGKSRLVAEALSAWPSHVSITIRAEAYSASNPYRAVRDPLRRVLGVEAGQPSLMAAQLRESVTRFDASLLPILPLIGAAAHVEMPETPETSMIEPRFRPDLTADAVERLLAAALPEPLVLLIEDAQWMDEASSYLLERLSAAAIARRWAVVVTTRSLVEGFRPGTGDVIALQPLTEAEATKVLQAATEAAPLRPHEIFGLAQQSGGNPLFLEELVRVARETGNFDSLPDSLEGVVAAEIDALSSLPRRLLRYSSVLGTRFRRVVLDELLAPEEIGMDASTRRALSRFVVPDGAEGWSFRNAMMRDAAYQGLSFRKRRQLHDRAGTIIEKLAGEDPASASELSLHYSLSGQYQKAWLFSRAAGDRACQTYANIEAGRHYERAIESARHLGEVPPEDLTAIWAALGDVREQAGLYEEALAAFSAASRLSPDPVAKADLLLKRARARSRVGAYAPALREVSIARRALVGLDMPEAVRARARLTSFYAVLRQFQQRFRAARSLAELAVAEAEQANEPEALARSYQVLDAAYIMTGQPSKAIYGTKALEIYEQLKDLASVAVVTNNLGAQAYFEGNWDLALDYYARARQAYKRAGNEPEAASAAANIAEVLVNQRRLVEAEEMLTEAMRVGRAHHLVDVALFAELQWSRVLVLQGQKARATDLLNAVRAEALAVGQTQLAVEAAIHLASALVDEGQPAEAIGLLDSAEQTAGDEAEGYACPLARIRASALAALGRHDEALARIDEGLRVARRQGLVYEEAMLLLVKAEVEATDPDAKKTEEEAHRLLLSLGVVFAAA
jgi:class 3 adenylate cyclase/tetratricopeptide (TPR) repeat protein